MVRRRLRPSFSAADEGELIAALGTARRFVIRCSGALPFGSERYRLCHGVTKAIDLLAEDLTGDREFFWDGAGDRAMPDSPRGAPVAPALDQEADPFVALHEGDSPRAVRILLEERRRIARFLSAGPVGGVTNTISHLETFR